MTDTPPRIAPDVRDAPERSRYEARVGDRVAGTLAYRLVEGDVIVLVSTKVDPVFEGGGIGSAIVRHALEDARARRLHVVPRCPFVATYLKRHPEYADVIAGPEASPCSHLDQIHNVTPSGDGCLDCLKIGGEWLHLRLCLTCGGVRCCDGSPNRHASKHAHEVGHPLVQSFEPGEDWLWCYVDEVMLEPA